MKRYQISVVVLGSQDNVDAYADLLHDIPGVDTNVTVEYVGVEDYEDED